jgi:hypothetical protein
MQLHRIVHKFFSDPLLGRFHPDICRRRRRRISALMARKLHPVTAACLFVNLQHARPGCMTWMHDHDAEKVFCLANVIFQVYVECHLSYRGDNLF